jgi:hypothetical protein
MVITISSSCSFSILHSCVLSSQLRVKEELEDFDWVISMQ